ncbi:InlB B-repeat-containing protein [Cohnella panacarvi]|uniref:InlB B-repeat-containing protein n=1 Tax=Cohnella panacarvi TaxID=400776 RepID=UPI00047CA3DB|nr:InlB B-repeat-containing protein [Cohnella panacarvi]
MRFGWKKASAAMFAAIVGILGLFILGSSQASAATTKFVTVGDAGISDGIASYKSFFVDNGTPYVAYMDAGNSNKATVEKYDGSSWVTVGTPGFTSDIATHMSLYVYEGTPYLSFTKGTSPRKAIVMKYDGSDWLEVGSGGVSEGDATTTSLYVYNGTPYLAYRDEQSTFKIKVAKYNGSNWETLGNGPVSEKLSIYPSLYVYNGTPYVAYKQYGGWQKVSVKKYNGSAWELVGADEFTTDADSLSMSIAGDGTPYVVYREFEDPHRTTVYKYDGSAWVTVGGDRIIPSNALSPSIYLDGNTPYVAFTDSAVTKSSVMKFNGSSWEFVGQRGISADSSNSALVYVDDGIPYVAFMDSGYSSGVTVMTLKYAVIYDGNGATSGTVPDDGNGYEMNASATILGNSGNLVRTGYTFTGWNTKPDGTGTDYDAGDTAAIGTEGVMLYAQWSINSYAVAFDGNGSESGTAPAGGSYVYNSNNTLPGNTGGLAKIGYTFAGWNTQPNGNGTDYAAGSSYTMGAGDVTLYAKWTINSYSLSYDGNGATSGSAPAGGSHNYSSDVVVAGSGSLVRTGYTFEAWNRLADGTGTVYAPGTMLVMGASDTTLYAKWTINSYTVAYDGNGSESGMVPASGSHVYDTSVTVQGNPGTLTRTGYSLTGWNTKADGTGTNYAAAAAFTIGAADVTLYAKWTPNHYAVNYDGNGASSGSAPAGGSHEFSSSVTLPGNIGNLAKTGYSFAGWNTQADGNGTNYGTGDTFLIGAADVTLYAKWTINSYALNYDGNGASSGTAPADSSHEYGTSVAVLDNAGNLVKTGHTFAGWNTQADGNGTNYGTGDTFLIGAADVTLYAKWTVNSYAVNYDGNGATSGTAPTDGDHDFGTSVTVLDNVDGLVKTGYSFAGWNTQADGNGTSYAANATFTMGAADVTLFAQWTINSFPVTFDSNGGSPVTSKTVTYGSTVTEPDTVPTKTGYTFAGWYADGDLETAFDFDSAIEDHTTLYAKWTVNRYTVNYDGNGSTSGSAPSGGSFDYDTNVTVGGNAGNLVKTGYSFSGWNTAADGSGAALAADATFNMGAADVTLYAQWTINSYTIVYDGNGATSGIAPSGGSHEYQTELSVSGNAGMLERIGYTFSGWNTAADGNGTDYAAGDALMVGAEGVTLFAKWAVNSYAVSYDGNGATSGSAPGGSSHDYGTSVAVSGNTGNLEKPGYSFAGWNTAANGSGMHYGAGDTFSMGAGDIALYAQWASNNAQLSVLSVDQGVLSPAFSPSGLNYDVELDDTVSTLNISFAGTDPSQEISVTGAVYQSVTDAVYTYRASELIIGSTPIRINVTAEDGSENVYTVNVNRVSGSNADLSGIVLSGGTLNPVFASEKTDYVSNVGNGVTSLTVTANVSDPRATITINGRLAANGLASDAIHLDVGRNELTLVVTARDGLTTKTYTIVVTRASSSSGGGGGGNATVPVSGVPASDNGLLTLPVGKEGEVSLEKAITVSIPAGASDRELQITIEKVLNTEAFVTDNVVLTSPIFEILKNQSESFSKPVTLTFVFDPAILKSGQKAAVFYYDEANKKWVEVGGEVNGNRITVEVDHFTKFAVLAAGDAEEVPANPIVFADIAGHWAEAAITQSVRAGIVNGYTNGQFKPDDTVTREEFAVMLAKALKLQGEAAPLAFTDSAKIGAWAKEGVSHAVSAGILSGYEDGRFRPDAEITRSEMAVMLERSIGMSEEEPVATGFADDSGIPVWAKGAVNAIQKLGLVKGKNGNRFDPSGSLTRAEAVTVLLNLSAAKNESRP